MSLCGGLTSYFACPLDLGGVCCPQGLICGSNGACTSSVVTTSTTTAVLCDQGWFACPSSFGGQLSKLLAIEKRLIDASGGCCLGGGICGPGECTFYAPASTTTISASSSGQTGPVVSTISSTSITSQIDPTMTSFISTEVQRRWGPDRGSDRRHHRRSRRGIPSAGDLWMADYTTSDSNIAFHGQV